MSRLSGVIRLRTSPPLALQIMALLMAGLIVAQMVTLGLTMLLPPPPPHQYRLQEIASALRGAEIRSEDARPLVRTLRSQPPSLQSAGWLVSERSRHELALLLGVEEGEVRLLFYSPLPFAGAGGLADMGLGDGDSRHPPLRPASMTVLDGSERQFDEVALGFGAPGGRAGGMPAGGGGLPRGGLPSGDFPGGGFPAGGSSGGGGSDGGGPPNGHASTATTEPPVDRQTSEPPVQGPTSSSSPPPATVTPAPQTPAGGVGQTSRPQTAGVGQAGSGPPTGGSAPSGPGGGSPAGEVRPGSAESQTGGGDTAPIGTDPASPSDSLPDDAGPKPSTVRPPDPRGAYKGGGSPAVIRPPLDTDGLIAPAPWVAARTGDTSGWIVSTPQFHRSGLFGLAASPFVQGDFVAALEAGPGRWITVQPRPEPFPNIWQRRIILWFSIAFAVVGPIGWLFARSLARPLDEFASAAERLGRDPSGAAAQLAGPAEIGRAARAFNGMQARLKRFVDDRTAMVGAISHDLRTPLARMRFRMERAPEEVKAGMLNDIGQMEDMISSVLVFIRDASEPSLRERVDLRSILECVVDDAALMGGDAVLETGDPLSVEVDSLGVQRVLTNLVDNALKYGTRAEVRMYAENGEAVAEVIDDGPGLHPDELERVFRPFYRSEVARTLNKGGIGLGLAVSRSIARAHGGDIQLMSDGAGVRAQLRLPLALRAA